jgi:3-oxoacyl-[acyl-carrier protein] reductase
MKDMKVAIVTGAGSGVGRDAASLLHRKGYAVLVLDMNAEAARAHAAALDAEGHPARAAAVNVCDEAAAAAAVAEALSAWGRIDVLVNNAGMPQANLPFEEVTAEMWSKILAVNVLGIVNMCRATVPHMRAQRAGSIVNVTSVSGVRARHGMSAYCAAKAAAISLTQTLALELATDGIKVNAIAPGALDTPMFEKFLRPGETMTQAMERYLSHIPLQRLGFPAEIAEAIAWVAGEAPGFMTGQNIVIDGGRSL